MKIIRPLSITDAVLTSSNIGETVAAYAGGTTYAAGDTVSVATGTTLTIYESLLDGNAGNTPASSPLWWRVISSAYAAYAGGTTYSLADRVQVIGADSHLVYESLQAGNTGHTPATSPTWWALVGATNRWAMFDASVSGQATRLDRIEFQITPTGRVDSIALLNVSASSVRVVQHDATDGDVFDQTTLLSWSSGITDWYRWFFEPVVRRQDIVISGLLPYSGATITVTLDDPGETVAIGECVAGLSREIGGGLQLGAKIGIQDYSVKTVDDFGNYSITPRAFAKTGDFTIHLAPGDVDETQRLLALYRATPIVYVGDDAYAGTILYGFFRDFAITIAYPTISVCTLTVEGLT